MSVSTTAAVKLCAVEGCGKRAKGRGRLCSAHYEARRMADRPPARRWRGQECLVPGCERPNPALGLCKVHAQRAYSANEQPWLSPEIEAQVRARRAAHT